MHKGLHTYTVYMRCTCGKPWFYPSCKICIVLEGKPRFRPADNHNPNVIFALDKGVKSRLSLPYMHACICCMQAPTRPSISRSCRATSTNRGAGSSEIERLRSCNATRSRSCNATRSTSCNVTRSTSCNVTRSRSCNVTRSRPCNVATSRSTRSS